MSHDTANEENESMRDEKPPDVFSVHPMNVLVQAYQRRLQQADPAQNDTITIERSLFDDLIRVTESCQKLQMADEPLRKRRIVIEGEQNTFCCNIEYLTDVGGLFLNVHANGKSVLEAFLVATRAFESETEKLIR
jgi:hypothetical protein